MIDDGTYDVMVVDATEVDGTIAIDLTFLDGPHKGELLTLRTSDLARDPLDLLAVPGTVQVTNGQPRLRLEG